MLLSMLTKDTHSVLLPVKLSIKITTFNLSNNQTSASVAFQLANKFLPVNEFCASITSDYFGSLTFSPPPPNKRGYGPIVDSYLCEFMYPLWYAENKQEPRPESKLD